MFIVQTSAVRKVSVVQLVVQKGSPLGKVDKTKMDNTTAPFLLLKLLFSMCHLLSHTGSFSSLWQPHTACKKRNPGFIRETPPKGSLSRALYFAAGDMTECRMVSKAPQYVAPDRRHCHYRYCRKNVLFRAELPCGPVSLGKYHSLVYGKPSYFICRYIIKSFMLGQPARNTVLSIPSRCSLLFYFFMRKKWLTIYLFMSIFNLEKNHFSVRFLALDLSQGCVLLPLFLHVHLLLP